jgi:hypothetical protein
MKVQGFTWLTRLSMVVLAAALLASTLAVGAVPVEPAAAASCWMTVKGATSCRERCDAIALCASPDYIQWSCQGRNMYHRQYLVWNQYEKFGGLWDAGKYCAYSSPENCPSFCN